MPVGAGSESWSVTFAERATCEPTSTEPGTAAIEPTTGELSPHACVVMRKWDVGSFMSLVRPSESVTCTTRS